PACVEQNRRIFGALDELKQTPPDRGGSPPRSEAVAIDPHRSDPDPAPHLMPARGVDKLLGGMLRDRNVVVEHGEVEPLHVPFAEPLTGAFIGEIDRHIFVHALMAQAYYSGPDVHAGQPS